MHYFTDLINVHFAAIWTTCKKKGYISPQTRADLTAKSDSLTPAEFYHYVDSLFAVQFSNRRSAQQRALMFCVAMMQKKNWLRISQIGCEKLKKENILAMRPPFIYYSPIINTLPINFCIKFTISEPGV